MYKSEKTSEEVAEAIAGQLTEGDLAEFIVDAFNRGWISVGNLGLNEDGDVI